MVRDFGNMMVTGHTETTRQLMAAVSAAGMPPPPMPQLSPRHQNMLAELRNVPAAQFDDRYMAQQVMAHQEALNLHRTFAERGDRPALRDHAARTVPAVQMHLDMAQRMRFQR
jgi:putative membrane protein